MGRRRGRRVEASELRAGGETEGSLRETREMGRGTSLGIKSSGVVCIPASKANTRANKPDAGITRYFKQKGI